MSDDPVPKEFWERADKIIALANEQLKDAPVGNVSSSLLYAAARFNSFNVASVAKDVDQLIKDKDDAIKYFTEQYENMLSENLDDYIENYGRFET